MAKLLSISVSIESFLVSTHALKSFDDKSILTLVFSSTVYILVST